MNINQYIKSGTMWGHSLSLTPIIAACKAASLLPGPNFVYEYYAQLLAAVPGLLGRDIRNAFYRHTLKKCGTDLRMGFGSFILDPNTEIGDHVRVSFHTTVGLCSIGDNVLIASHVSILDGTHQHGAADLNTPMNEQEGHSTPVVIGNDCWIGEGAKVAASIGDKTVVGVGAIVLREVQSSVVVLGNPARVVSHRDKPMTKSN